MARLYRKLGKRGSRARRLVTQWCERSPWVRGRIGDASRRKTERWWLGPHALTHDAERAQRALSDPLVYHGWIQNRTAIALLDARARCKALLSKWGDGAFPFLLVHGGHDTLCPRSACDALLAAAPQHDKELKVYDGLLHEVIHERSPDRERALADIVAWLRVRLVAAAPLPSKL